LKFECREEVIYLKINNLNSYAKLKVNGWVSWGRGNDKGFLSILEEQVGNLVKATCTLKLVTGYNNYNMLEKYHDE
jgi:hypothetical protein